MITKPYPNADDWVDDPPGSESKIILTFDKARKALWRQSRNKL
jgi:hypothetical protein